MQNEKDEFLVHFGRVIREQRKKMGLSQVVASDQLDIDYRHYQNIEGGKINLRFQTFRKIMHFYRFDIQFVALKQEVAA